MATFQDLTSTHLTQPGFLLYVLKFKKPLIFSVTNSVLSILHISIPKVEKFRVNNFGSLEVKPDLTSPGLHSLEFKIYCQSLI